MEQALPGLRLSLALRGNLKNSNHLCLLELLTWPSPDSGLPSPASPPPLALPASHPPCLPPLFCQCLADMALIGNPCREGGSFLAGPVLAHLKVPLASQTPIPATQYWTAERYSCRVHKHTSGSTQLAFQSCCLSTAQWQRGSLPSFTKGPFPVSQPPRGHIEAPVSVCSSKHTRTLRPHIFHVTQDITQHITVFVCEVAHCSTSKHFSSKTSAA